MRQIQELFHGEKLRFYCCGGSGTLRNMLNGFEHPEDAEIAFYPCGLSNDILKVFGKDAQMFTDIEELIHGEVVEVDYLRTNHGICLNSFSMGLDAEVLNAMNVFRGITQLGKQLPYTLSLINTLIKGKPKNVAVYMDGQKMDCRVTEIIFGNGCTIGGNLHFSKEANLRDGKGDFFLAPAMNKFSLFRMMRILQKKKFEDAIVKKAEFGTWRQARIVSLDGNPIMGNQDGELLESSIEWSLEIVPKGLHLVVPKGVSV